MTGEVFYFRSCSSSVSSFMLCWFCLGHAFPLLPSDQAWLFATRPVFLYPELLPVCSLDPALHTRHHRSVYTAGEDGYVGWQ